MNSTGLAVRFTIKKAGVDNVGKGKGVVRSGDEKSNDRGSSCIGYRSEMALIKNGIVGFVFLPGIVFDESEFLQFLFPVDHGPETDAGIFG